MNTAPLAFLTPAEVAQLTGYAQAKRQVAYLKAERIPHRVNAAGMPLVARAWVERRLGGANSDAPAADPPNVIRPNFAVLRRG